MTAPKTFDFEHNGKKFQIPTFDSLPMGAIRKGRKAKDEGDAVFTILESLLAEDSAELAAIDSMSADQFTKFIEAWTQGAGVGEASSSES
jgi:hypothetical protein